MTTFPAWIIAATAFALTCAQCTLPSRLQTSTWMDSDKGTMQFTSTGMTGWSFKNPAVGTGTIEDWDCYFVDENGSSTLLIFKATEAVILYSKSTRPFLCMSLTAITEYSYYYYLLWAEQDQIDFDRITMRKEALVSGILNPTLELCLNQSDAEFPTDNEYHMLVKQGNELDAIQTCPSTFFGEYYYTVSDLNAGTTTCGTGDERWDVCTDTQRMMFNYTICPAQIAYSGNSVNGSVFCLVTITTGSYTFHSVYNEDGASTSANRFTCFMSSVSGDGSLSVSQSPGSCTKNQTPNTQPTLTNSTVVGLNMQLTPHAITTTTTTTTATSTSAQSEVPSTSASIAAIAGGTIGALVALAAIAILIICLYLKVCRPRDKETKEKLGSSSSSSKAHEKNTPNDAEDDVSTSHQKKTDEGEKKVHIPPQQMYICDGSVKDLVGEFTKIDETETPFCDDSVKDFVSEFTRPDEADISNNNLTTECTVKELNIPSENALPARDDIEITRIIQTPDVLRKFETHMNSTENIIMENNPPMSHHSSYTTRSRMFEFSRDDSQGKTNAEDEMKPIVHQSECNILEAVQNETLKRRSSFRSVLSTDTIEWGFVYNSPYALTFKQKSAALERKLNVQKRRKQAERRQLSEKLKRETETSQAFELWKKRKTEENNNSKIKLDTSTRAAVDIEDMPHTRYPHWIHGPQGTAPRETHFKGHECMNKSSLKEPTYHPILLPPLTLKKLTTKTDTEIDKDNGFPWTNDAEVKRVGFPRTNNNVLPGIIKQAQKTNEFTTTHENTPGELTMSNNLNAESINRNLGHLDHALLHTPNDIAEYGIPDNPVLAQAQFDRENLKNTGLFVKVASADYPGPENDHQFQEKQNTRSSTARSLTGIELSTSSDVNTYPFHSIDKSNGMPENNGDALVLLSKSKTFVASQNKSGSFYNENVPIDLDNNKHASPVTVHDGTTGIAYDEDNQIARALRHLSDESFEIEQHREKIHNMGDTLLIPFKSNTGKSSEHETLEKAKSKPKIIRVKEQTDAVKSPTIYTSAFFLENEIRQSVNEIREDFYFKEYEKHNYPEEESEYEDENLEEDECGEDLDVGDSCNVVDRPGIVTSMTVLYGDSTDPDKMYIDGYESELIDIKD